MIYFSDFYIKSIEEPLKKEIEKYIKQKNNKNLEIEDFNEIVKNITFSLPVNCIYTAYNLDTEENENKIVNVQSQLQNKNEVVDKQSHLQIVSVEYKNNKLIANIESPDDEEYDVEKTNYLNSVNLLEEID